MSQTPSRVPDHPVNPLFLDRWSPRGFTDETLPQADLDTMFEAARWARSASNLQPWRFVFAHRGGPGWEAMLSCLVPFNQTWAAHAAALVMVLSKRVNQASPTDEPKVSHSHSFDAGAAWMSLALQAHTMGWVAHGMTGVDFAKARDVLKVPEDFKIEAAIAIGRHGAIDRLPDALRAREVHSGRNPVASFVSEGVFKG